MATATHPGILGRELAALAPQPLAAPASPQATAAAVRDLPFHSRGFLGLAATVRSYYQVVEHCGSGEQLADRAAFWQHYITAEAVSQAWLVVAPLAAAVARAEVGLQPLQFGEFVSGATDPKQAALLLRLGRVVVFEWGRRGQARIWFQGNLVAPQLYQRQYHAAQLLQGCDHKQPYYFSEQGRWQTELALWLQQQGQVKNCWQQPAVAPAAPSHPAAPARRHSGR